jgi:hypothetical protein
VDNFEKRQNDYKEAAVKHRIVIEREEEKLAPLRKAHEKLETEVSILEESLKQKNSVKKILEQGYQGAKEQRIAAQKKNAATTEDRIWFFFLV